jgi:hypothetical protein
MTFYPHFLPKRKKRETTPNLILIWFNSFHVFGYILLFKLDFFLLAFMNDHWHNWTYVNVKNKYCGGKPSKPES